MKKNKYIIIALVCILLSPFFYKYYLYYTIYNNPIARIESTVTSCSVAELENTSDDYNTLSSSHKYDCSVIYNYLKDLKLKPLKYSDYNKSFDIKNVNYRYVLSFSQPDLYDDFSIGVWDKDLSIIYISSTKPGFKDGYYKIVNSKMDYKYINELISLEN